MELFSQWQCSQDYGPWKYRAWRPAPLLSIFPMRFVTAAATSLRGQPRPVWQSTSSARVQGTTPKRLNTTLRAIAVGVGAGMGFMAGGRVGWEVTPSGDLNDDTSGLKGVMIGAPIGAWVPLGDHREAAQRAQPRR